MTRTNRECITFEKKFCNPIFCFPVRFLLCGFFCAAKFLGGLPPPSRAREWTQSAPITRCSGSRAVHGAARANAEPCYAGVSSDRTNLSPFTKDYRGLALPCDLRVFAARKGAIIKKKKKYIYICPAVLRAAADFFFFFFCIILICTACVSFARVCVFLAPHVGRALGSRPGGPIGQGV